MLLGALEEEALSSVIDGRGRRGPLGGARRGRAARARLELQDPEQHPPDGLAVGGLVLDAGGHEVADAEPGLLLLGDRVDDGAGAQVVPEVQHPVVLLLAVRGDDGREPGAVEQAAAARRGGTRRLSGRARRPRITHAWSMTAGAMTCRARSRPRRRGRRRRGSRRPSPRPSGGSSPGSPRRRRPRRRSRRPRTRAAARGRPLVGLSHGASGHGVSGADGPCRGRRWRRSRAAPRRPRLRTC